MKPEEALGASKKYTDDSLKGIGALKGANCTIVSIVNDDVNKESVVVYAWLDDIGVQHTDTMKVPYGKDGVSIVAVRISDDGDYFIFTNSEGVDLDPVPLPDELKVKISKEEGNALVEKEDGLYVSLTGFKISEADGNQLETKEDGLYVPETALSDAEGNILERKEDGIYASADKIAISEKAGNTLSLEEDGLYVPETALSEAGGNILERKEDGIYASADKIKISEKADNVLTNEEDGLYVPSLEVNVSDLNDANKLLNIKVGDTVNQSVVIPCKTTVLSANVQQFGSADSVELYKYADGVSIYSQSLIDTDSDGVVVYDQNLRRFGNVKVNDDGLTFTLTGRESEFTFNINPSLVAETVKLHDEGFNIVLNELNEDYGVYIDINDVVSDITREEFDTLAEKVAEIELFKFPNAVIKGEPVVNNGQISGFSSSNYLVLPSVFDLAGRGFEFKFAFTTDDDVTLAQNILGSKYCMALYIKDSKLSLRVSSDGVSWDIVNLDGDYAIEANKTYYVKVAFDRLGYKLSISLDDITYDEIGSVTTGDISPKPSELYLGIGNNFNNPFRGILNINKCYLKVNNSIIWQGMDDAGLATRLATDLENIDESGIAKVKEIAETDDIKAKIAELELFKFPNATIHGVPTINNGQISGFSANNYLAFPFLVDFGERNFVIDMAFTTGSDVTNQQNIIDGKFGLALAIKNSKFVLAISTNGESWDLGAKEGTYTVLPDTNYYLRLSFDHTEYKLSYSLNRESYVDDITVTSSVRPYPVRILIGIGDLDTVNPKPFGGIINMNYCYLTINDTVVWRGMDDAGLSTRLSVDLANVDAAGIAKIKDIMKDSLDNKLDLDLNNISDDGVSTLNEKIKVDPDTSNTIVKNDNGLFSQKEVINITRENYNKLTPEQKALDVIYNVYDEGISGSVIIDDEADPAPNILYSSKKINDSLVDKVPFKFGITEDGKYGYIKDGADTVTPFKSGSKYEFFATSSDNFNTEEDMYNAIIVLGRNTTPTLKVGGVTINATEKVYYGGYVSRFEKIDYIPKGTNIITQGRGFIIHEVPPIDSGSEKITTTGGFAPNSASTFVLGKDCDEINVTLGFITSMYTVVVDGVDMTSSFQNYGYNVNGVGLSQGTLKGDFHSGTELVVTNKSAGGVLGYTITY